MNMEGDAAIHYNLGQAYTSKRQLDKAHQAYARSVTQDSTYWQAWSTLHSDTSRPFDKPKSGHIAVKVINNRVVAVYGPSYFMTSLSHEENEC